MSSWERGRGFWRPALLRFEDEILGLNFMRMESSLWLTKSVTRGNMRTIQHGTIEPLRKIMILGWKETLTTNEGPRKSLF